MSLSEVYRDRYYSSGYVYVAGSLSERVLKIGVTINIHQQQAYLRNRCYGGIGDWVLLYYVHVDSGGEVEHDARSYVFSALWDNRPRLEIWGGGN